MSAPAAPLGERAGGLLSRLDTQPRVRDFLRRAVETGRASHAYMGIIKNI